MDDVDLRQFIIDELDFEPSVNSATNIPIKHMTHQAA
jgi:hypothetical protein